MCFRYDALPPDLPADLALPPPVAGGAAAERLELTSADGTEFSAALATSDQDGDGKPGVVILPDVRGLYRFYVELAERFAQAGHSAIAIDYFGRTAGTGERGEDFEYMPHMMKTRVDQVQADTAAAADALRGRTGNHALTAVGFCFGGLQAFLAAASAELDPQGVVGFYGILDSSRFRIPTPAERAPDFRCPVLGLFGGADEAIPQAHIDEFEKALTGAGVDHELHVYPGAPHSFFDRRYEEHAEASEDAWRRVLGFLERTNGA